MKNSLAGIFFVLVLSSFAFASTYQVPVFQDNDYILGSFHEKTKSASCYGSDSLASCKCESNYLLIAELIGADFYRTTSGNTCNCTYRAPSVGCGILVNCPWIKATATCNLAPVPVNAQPVISGIPNLQRDEGSSAAHNLIDLRNYSYDNETSDNNLRFSIVSQTNS